MRHSGIIVVSPKSERKDVKQDRCQSIARQRPLQKEVGLTLMINKGEAKKYQLPGTSMKSKEQKWNGT